MEKEKSSVPYQVQQWKHLHETFMLTLNIIQELLANDSFHVSFTHQEHRLFINML